MTHWVCPSKDGFKQRDQASFGLVAAPWPRNERQIKAGDYLELSSFRDAPLGAGPESILPIVVMDSLICNFISKLASSTRPGMTLRFNIPPSPPSWFRP